MRFQIEEWFDQQTGALVRRENRSVIECSRDPNVSNRLYWTWLPLGWQHAGWAMGL